MAVGEDSGIKGGMSLVELRERSLNEAKGLETLTDTMAAKAKKDFVHLASQFKNNKLSKLSLETVRLSQEVLLGQGKVSKEERINLGESGDGLDLIFRKLNELRDEIDNEQKVAYAEYIARKEECQGFYDSANNIIQATSDRMTQNYNDVEEARTKTLPDNRKLWDDSRNIEDETQVILTGEQAERASYAALVRSEVDEK